MISGRTKRADLLFFLAFGIYLTVQILSSTLVSALVDFTYIRFAAFFVVNGLLTVKLYIDGKYKTFWVYCILLAILFITGSNVSYIRDLIILGFLTLEARNVDFDAIVKEQTILVAFFLASILLLFALGLFKKVDTSILRETSDRMRFSLGFGWTSYASNYFFSVVVGILFLYSKKKCPIVLLLLLFAGNYFFYYMTDTKAAFYETILLIALYFGAKTLGIRMTKFKIIRAVMPLAFLICAAIAVWFAYHYTSGSSVMQKLNEITTNRLYLSNKAVHMYRIRPFGNYIEWVTTPTETSDYMYVDSSFVQILLQYGSVAFTYILCLFTLLLRYYVRKRDDVSVICLLMIALHSITEPQLFNVAYTPFLLSLGMILSEIREQKRNVYIRRKREMRKRYGTTIPQLEETEII